jgi:hypothetical protein
MKVFSGFANLPLGILLRFWAGVFFGTLLSPFAAEIVAMTGPALQGD